MNYVMFDIGVAAPYCEVYMIGICLILCTVLVLNVTFLFSILISALVAYFIMTIIDYYWNPNTQMCIPLTVLVMFGAVVQPLASCMIVHVLKTFLSNSDSVILA